MASSALLSSGAGVSCNLGTGFACFGLIGAVQDMILFWLRLLSDVPVARDGALAASSASSSVVAAANLVGQDISASASLAGGSGSASPAGSEGGGTGATGHKDSS